MAENKDGTEKSEEATPQHRESRRKEGSVAKSADLTSGVLLVVIVLGFYYYAPYFMNSFKGFFSETLQFVTYNLNEDSTYYLFIYSLKFMAQILMPMFILLFVIAVAINIYQVGFFISGKAIEPKFDKLNFFANFMKTFFSMRKVVDLIKSLTKIFLLSVIAWYAVAEEVSTITRMIDADIMDQMAYLGELIFDILLKLALLVLAIGVADFSYQKWQHNKDIRMTKQEIKEEYKRSEGDPQVRSRIRQAQQDAARKRMLDDVPKSDLVITNPTHYAVAISYKIGVDRAPKIVAKGKGLIALKIKELAIESRIDVVVDPPLARLLYDSVSIGDEVPENLYQALAAILGTLSKYGLNKR